MKNHCSGGINHYHTLLVVLIMMMVIMMSMVNGEICTHPVYCQGPLLETVQMAKIFNDSKTFVDMPLKSDPYTVLSQFSMLMNSTAKGGGPTPQELSLFLEQHFLEAGADVVVVEPTDWRSNPAFIGKIENPLLRAFGNAVHQKWRELYRAFNHTGLCDTCYSSVEVPNPFIIAGSRFREFYYWDSYWMIKGLLVSEMTETARGMIVNMLTMIQKYGFVPNGGRIYYSDRSQLPLLAAMVDTYYQATGDSQLLSLALPILDDEYQFWMTERAVRVDGQQLHGHILNLFNATTTTPRPESFYEDATMAMELPLSEHVFFYSSIASAAESGMDFSTRWMETGSLNLSTIRTIEVVPVDLNAVLYMNENILSNLHTITGNQTMSQYYATQASARALAIHDVFWDESSYQWYDYHLDTQQLSTNFYVSNLVPLWTKVYQENTTYFNNNTLSNILKNVYSIIMNDVGGVPTSIINSQQQWDYPNAWPPHQYFVFESLFNIDSEMSNMMANDLIERWMTTNYCGWAETLNNGGMMFEKYNVSSIGLAGGGGEYVVQDGFGWTNGVILHLLDKFGLNLSPRNC